VNPGPDADFKKVLNPKVMIKNYGNLTLAEKFEML